MGKEIAVFGSICWVDQQHVSERYEIAVLSLLLQLMSLITRNNLCSSSQRRCCGGTDLLDEDSSDVLQL